MPENLNLIPRTTWQKEEPEPLQVVLMTFTIYFKSINQSINQSINLKSQRQKRSHVSPPPTLSLLIYGKAGERGGEGLMVDFRQRKAHTLLSAT